MTVGELLRRVSNPELLRWQVLFEREEKARQKARQEAKSQAQQSEAEAMARKAIRKSKGKG